MASRSSGLRQSNSGWFLVKVARYHSPVASLGYQAERCSKRLIQLFGGLRPRMGFQMYQPCLGSSLDDRAAWN